MERQELFCHNCRRYVNFLLDTELDGNHIIVCPNCKHEHCRVGRNGIITDDRWDQRNGPNIYVSPHVTGTSTTASAISWFVYGSTTTGGY